MNKLSYFIGKCSKKYRNRWMRKHAKYPWGLCQFMRDFPVKRTSFYKKLEIWSEK